MPSGESESGDPINSDRAPAGATTRRARPSSRRRHRCPCRPSRRRSRPARGSACPGTAARGQRSGRRSTGSSRSGSGWRSIDCQWPCPESSPVPVQVTQTSCTPADGSPVTRAENLTRRAVRHGLHLADRRRRCQRGLVGAVARARSPRVEEPRVEARVGALGVRCAPCSVEPGVGAVLRGRQDQRGASARAQRAEVVRRDDPLRPEGAELERRLRRRCPRWPGAPVSGSSPGASV